MAEQPHVHVVIELGDYSIAIDRAFFSVDAAIGALDLERGDGSPVSWRHVPDLFAPIIDDEEYVAWGYVGSSGKPSYAIQRLEIDDA